MLGFPASTEFGKRIPKQKFYENLEVSPALRRVFVDQIRLVYWRNACLFRRHSVMCLCGCQCPSVLFCPKLRTS